MVIGIPWEGITGGMEAIGLDHRTRELAGLSRIMMGSSSLLVTGKEIAAVLNTITTGTATTSGTSTTEIMAGTARGITRGITSGITNYEGAQNSPKAVTRPWQSQTFYPYAASRVRFMWLEPTSTANERPSKNAS